MTHTNFAIRTYGKSEFALLMFPTIDDPKVAEEFRGYGGAGVRWYENSIRRGFRSRVISRPQPLERLSPAPPRPRIPPQSST